MDEVRRAYAVLELTPPVDADTLRRQYRRLAKKWHPDRHAGDPAALADASDRMRRINDAFRLVASSLDSAPAPAEHPSAPRWSARRYGGPRMSREEIEEMVASINRSNEWTFWPHMTRDRGYSLGVVAVYFVSALALPRSAARFLAVGIAYSWAPLFLIWMAEAERTPSEARPWLRRLGWAFLALPALTAVLGGMAP